jgi:ribosomal-protein-alanine N-acetyltransferase
MSKIEIALRLVQSKDFNALLEMFHEPETFKYIKPLENKSDAFYLSFLELKLKQSQSKEGFYWVILNPNEEILGAINLTPIPNTSDMQLGWQVKKSWHKQGIASSASKLALEFALEHTSIDPIYAVFEKENLASKKILDKLNFEHFRSESKNGEQLEKYIFRR